MKNGGEKKRDRILGATLKQHGDNNNLILLIKKHFGYTSHIYITYIMIHRRPLPTHTNKKKAPDH